MLPPTILLPGLHGTGALFRPLIAAAPSGWPIRVMPLPNDRPRGYEELAEHIRPLLQPERFALVAESFSGPLAILLADRCPQVQAVVLCASFVQPPLPRSLARLPAALWRRPPPAVAIRLSMAGGDRELARALQRELRAVPAEVIAARVRATLTVDIRPALERLSQPLLYLRATADRLVRPSSAARIRTLKPSAEFADIEGPHLLLQSRPVESWRRIETFVRRAARSWTGESGGLG